MTYESEVLADNPLIYWRLGEPSGTTAADLSGNGNDGTYNGAVTLGTTGLLTGDVDTAVTFDGTADDQYVKSNNDFGNTTYPAWTLECGISGLTADDEGGRSIVLLVDATYDHWIACFTRFIVGFTDMQIGFNWGGVGGPSGEAIVVVPMGSNTSHLAFTYDGTTAKAYLNGALSDSFPDAAGDADFGGVSAFFYAGGDDLGFADGMWGVVDEAAFYTHAVGATRVTAHHTAMTIGGGGPSACTNPQFIVSPQLRAYLKLTP